MDGLSVDMAVAGCELCIGVALSQDFVQGHVTCCPIFRHSWYSLA